MPTGHTDGSSAHPRGTRTIADRWATAPVAARIAAARQHPRDRFWMRTRHLPATRMSRDPRSPLPHLAPLPAPRPGQARAMPTDSSTGPEAQPPLAPVDPITAGAQADSQQAVTPDSQPRLSGQARGRASAHPQSPTSKTSCGPRRAGPTTCYPEAPSPTRPLSRSRQRGREFPEPHGIPTTRRLGRRVTHRYLLSNPYAAEVAAVPPRAGPDSRGYIQSGRDPSRRPWHNSSSGHHTSREPQRYSLDPPPIDNQVSSATRSTARSSIRPGRILES